MKSGLAWHSMTEQQVLDAWQVHQQNGLNRREVDRRRKIFGDNRLREQKHPSIVMKFLAQWKDFMILTLIGAAVISTVVSFCNGEKDLTDPIIIFVIITVNAILGVIQETKAEKSLDALKQMSAPSAVVLREGKKQKIDAALVVPGDIVYLETGSFVPADGRILESVDLRIEESALTGESMPVEKQGRARLSVDTPVAEWTNMALSSTIVTSGRGIMVVTETGMETQVGRIAGMIMADEGKSTPLQQRLAQTSKILGILALGICAIMFFVGLWKEQPLFDMFMTSVSLAVAAIPEGLPAIVTILLSQGVQRMAVQNAVVRKLPAVETLGSATVICSDKTGTLTQNRMTVTEIATAEGRIPMDSSVARTILTYAVLCNNAVLRQERSVRTNQWKAGSTFGRNRDSLPMTNHTILGEPTEKALVEAAFQAGLDKNDLERRYPRLKEIPFDSVRKQMTTVHDMGKGPVSIIKGAPDVLLHQCDLLWCVGKDTERPENMTPALRERILKQNERMAKEGIRILAVARTELGVGKLCFLGLIGMMDPPRPEVPEAVHTCRMAGIMPVMITGDHPATAAAIASKIGIQSAASEGKILSGQQLEAMTQEELIRRAPQIEVYARVSPEHKVRIVKALQATGQVVAMTGDGVNDAPALKTADIGCAMGRGGTDVAKNSADMILTDDNFATIVAAVKEGRVIYDNIRKTIHFLLSSNIGEILTIFTAIVMGYASPLLPVQLLWMNLVTDSLPAVALGAEKAERDIMTRKPAAKENSVFSGGLGVQMVLEGLMIGGLALVAYMLGNRWYDLEMARTMTFSVLSLSQLFHVYNIRSRDSLFRIGWLSNCKLNIAFLICFALQVGVVMIPPAAAVFGLVSMTLKQWVIVLGLSVAPIPFIELQKWLDRKER